MEGEYLPLEYVLLRQVSHVKGVIQLLDGIDIGNLFVLVMERMEPSRDLFHLVAERGPLSEELAKCYFFFSTFLLLKFHGLNQFKFN